MQNRFCAFHSQNRRINGCAVTRGGARDSWRKPRVGSWVAEKQKGDGI